MFLNICCGFLQGRASIRARQRIRNAVLHFRPALRNSDVFLTRSYTIRVHLASKSGRKTIEIELESNIWASLCFSTPVPFRGASWTCCEPPFCAWKHDGPQKVKAFLSQKPWTHKKWCLTMSGGHWRFKYIAFSHIGCLWKSRK